MKRLLTLMTVLIFTVGMTQAQSSDWSEGNILYNGSVTYSEIVTTETVYSDAIQLPEYMNIREETNPSSRTWKYPTKLSFIWEVLEATGDSTNLSKFIQFVDDTTGTGASTADWTTYVQLDTIISIATANQTLREMHVLTGFPEMDWFRIGSTHIGTELDTVDITGDRYTKSFTK